MTEIESHQELMSEEEMEELEREIRSDPVSWAYWKLKDPRGNPWKARWYQKDMIDGIMNGDRRIAARMGRRVGKCLPGWTKIFDPSTGKQVTIKELYEKKKASVVTMTSDYKLKRTTTDQVWNNGIKEVFKVTLKSGRIIEATGNHPLYRIDGWTEINDLQPGDKIATPRILNYFGNYDMPDHEIKFLAYMLGDGGTTSANLRFSTANSQVLQEFKQIVDQFKDAKVEQYEYSSSYDFHIHNADHVPKTRYKNKARVCLEKHGLFGKSALEKAIPDSIYQLPKRKIALFLSRLYATDGWATANVSPKKHLEIGYCSLSEELARGVQHLLLRFGIQSYLREKWVKYNGSRNKTFTVCIHGKQYIEIFSKEIGIFSKEENVKHVLQIANQMKGKDNALPKEIMKEVEELRVNNRIRAKEMIHPNASLNTRYRSQYVPQRKTLKHWGDVLDSKRLKDLGKSDLFWDEIKSIESIGMHQTYDLTIPETKNFVANDIIVHNTETMVVFALWYAFHHKKSRILITTPYEHQVRLIFMRLRELITDCEELDSSLETMTKNPFLAEFKNGSAIMGFTVGANKGQGGASVRGQRADWIIMDEVDYMSREGVDAVTAIALEAPKRIGIWCSSTPTGKRDFFYDICTNPKTGYKAYHFPSMVNPDWDEEMEGELRATMTEQGYIHEVEAEFGEETIGVFRKDSIEKAKNTLMYAYRKINEWERKQYKEQGYNVKDIYYLPKYTRGNPAPSAYRIVGVDWDKYQATPQIVVTEFNEALKKFQVVWREDIPQAEFTLDYAVNKIIEINDIYKPQYIYADRGFGEYQIEMLRIYGRDHPETNLDKKVKPIHFSEKINIVDPVTGEEDRKEAKDFMINQTSIILDRHQLLLSPFDDVIWKQMMNYQVVRVSQNGKPIYTSEDEHALDALMLTILGFTIEFPEITKILEELRLAKKSHMIDGERTEKKLREKVFGGIQDVWNNQKMSRRREARDEPQWHWQKVPLGYSKKAGSNYWGRRGSGHTGIRSFKRKKF